MNNACQSFHVTSCLITKNTQMIVLIQLEYYRPHTLFSFVIHNKFIHQVKKPKNYLKRKSLSSSLNENNKFPIYIHKVTQKRREKCEPGMVGLAPKWVGLAPNGTNPGLFQIRFQYIWLDEPSVLKSNLKKSQICYRTKCTKI